MNCFFASCEIAQNPALKGKKIAVAPNAKDRRGIILAASYEARPYGVNYTRAINGNIWRIFKKIF